MKSFDMCSDKEIVEVFNNEIGNGGWGKGRASFLGAFHEQLNIRKLDYTQIGNKGRYSLKEKWSSLVKQFM